MNKKPCIFADNQVEKMLSNVSKNALIDMFIDQIIMNRGEEITTEQVAEIANLILSHRGDRQIKGETT
jgi:membrane-associated HD superfamily phosphohydrolase